MKNKAILVMMASLLAAGSLAGCGGKDKEKEKEPLSEETAADDQGQDGSGAGTEEDNGDVKLKFWCDEGETQLFQEMIDSFIAEHKGEANIEVVYEPVAASVCKDVFLSDVMNGADVFCMPDDQLLTMASSGVLEEVENAGEVSGRNLEGSVDAASVDGKLYAYPLTADNGYFLYYDKQYFSEEDVKTLDRILEICAENEKKFFMDWSSGWYLYSFFGNTGLQLDLNADGLTNSCNWNATEGDVTGVDIAEAFLNISDSPGFLNGTNFDEAVKDGTAIAGVSGIWSVASVKEAFGGDYGACKLPTFTCAGGQIQMSSFKGYRLLGVNSYSAHRGWAEKLADYLTNEENQKLRFEREEHGPSNTNAAASDAVTQVPAIAAVLEQAEYGVLQKVGQKYWTPMTNFGKTMAAGNPNNVPLQDLLDQMVSAITER